MNVEQSLGVVWDRASQFQLLWRKADIFSSPCLSLSSSVLEVVCTWNVGENDIQRNGARFQGRSYQPSELVDIWDDPEVLGPLKASPFSMGLKETHLLSLCPFPIWMSSSHTKPGVLAKMDLDMEKIPQTAMFILFFLLPIVSMWAVVGKRGDHGGAQPSSWWGIWDMTCLIYLLQGFFKFYLLLLLARALFAFFELTLWASDIEHRTYKTTNFQEQKKTWDFCCFSAHQVFLSRVLNG